jgi:hypothetical protein
MSYTYKQINELCSASYQEALAGAKKELGKGCFRSRGRWVIVTRKDGGEPFVSNGQLEWNGTKKQLDSLTAEYANNPLVSGIYIDGGVDYGESVQAFTDGWYDPWVAEWSVEVLSQ